jgi:hypothetical protein
MFSGLSMFMCKSPVIKKPAPVFPERGSKNSLASTSVVEALDYPMPLLGGFQIFGARLSGLFVSNKLEGDFLSLIKAVHVRAFDCGLICTKTSFVPSSG